MFVACWRWWVTVQEPTPVIIHLHSYDLPRLEFFFFFFFLGGGAGTVGHGVCAPLYLEGCSQLCPQVALPFQGPGPKSMPKGWELDICLCFASEMIQEESASAGRSPVMCHPLPLHSLGWTGPLRAPGRHPALPTECRGHRASSEKSRGRRSPRSGF